MDSYNNYSSSSSHNYAPSAPILPESHNPQSPSAPPPPPSLSHQSQQQQKPSSPYKTSGLGQPSYSHPPSSYGYSSAPSQQQQTPSSPYKPSGPGVGQPSYLHPPSSYGYSSAPSYGVYFPPGTHPEIIRSFQMVDKDQSGFIDERELQEALSFGYQKFSLGTVRLLMFLFKNPNETLKIGPNEFAALWSCLGQWRAIFERFDRDRSGKIDSLELRDALYSLGYRIPDSVLQVLISKYDNDSGRRGELNFDSFVECGMIVKGLTEKFKEKDPRYTGSATLSYETFMTMVIPFLVS